MPTARDAGWTVGIPLGKNRPRISAIILRSDNHCSHCQFQKHVQVDCEVGYAVRLLYRCPHSRDGHVSLQGPGRDPCGKPASLTTYWYLLEAAAKHEYAFLGTSSQVHHSWRLRKSEQQLGNGKVMHLIL
jgi:hypothetical protein